MASLQPPSNLTSISQPPISTDAKATPDVAEEKYQIRPAFKNMLNPRVVKDIIQAVLNEQLKDKEYDQNETGNWTKEIASIIKNRLKELKLPRYKFLVQVMIGEMKGAGVRCGCRCLWDQQTDKVAEATFQNDSLFCVAVAFGIYLY